MDNRDIRIDVLKALAIVMVVAGHVFSGTILGGGRIGAFIIGMNMPLFFVISGYFAAKVVQDWRKVFARCFKYLRAMAAYSILIAIMFYCLGAYDTALLMLKRMVTIPLFGWWFMWSLMYSMVLMCIMLWVRRCLPQNSIYSMIIPIAFYVSLLLLPDSWYQVKYFKFCFPFFGLGVVIRLVSHGTVEIGRAQRRRVKLFVWLAAAAFYAVYVCFYKIFPTGFYWDNFNLSHILSSPKNFGAYIVRYLVALCGIITVSYPILHLKPNRVTRALAEFGTTTMGVYFLHQGILKHFVVPYYTNWQSVMSLCAEVIALWLSCHIITWYFNQHGILKKVFN